MIKVLDTEGKSDKKKETFNIRTLDLSIISEPSLISQSNGIVWVSRVRSKLTALGVRLSDRQIECVVGEFGSQCRLG